MTEKIVSIDNSNLTLAQKAADAVTEFCGSWPFIIAFTGITLVWMSLNTVFILFSVFDPYPYILLNLFLTVISTFQSPLIMMSQNRQTERDREQIQWLHEKLDDISGKLERMNMSQHADVSGRFEIIDQQETSHLTTAE